MSEEDQLKLWQAKGGQIEWRLEEAKRQVRAMEADLAECDRHIRALKEKLKRKPASEGQDE